MFTFILTEVEKPWGGGMLKIQQTSQKTNSNVIMTST